MNFRMSAALFIITVGLFLGCKNEKTNNKDTLAKETMVSIIAEVELSQAAFKIEDQDKKIDLDKITSLIFEKYHTSKKQFDESMRYYTKNPKELEEIYSEVISEISRLQADSRVE
tara:strand:- start:3678 stop:4022 length:345 start_codon:yes stop_codon:yes gene_type:complete